MKLSIELGAPERGMRALSILGDLLLLVGFAAIVYGLALYSVPLALIVGGLVVFVAGAALTALSMGGKRAELDRGPFDPSTADKAQ